MKPASLPPSTTRSLQEELDALRLENQQLRADQAAQANQQAKEDKYEQSQVRFRTVFDHSPLGNKIIDSDLVIKQVNPAVLAMLGFEKAEELVGRKIIEFAHPDHKADWTHLQESLWAHKLPYFVLETCLIRQDGSSFWCQVTSVLFQDEAGELGYTTLEDISERKKLAINHKRLYDAQETIMHLVAHDLKNPINNIKIVVALLQSHAGVLQIEPGSAQQDVQKLLTLANQSCETANVLLKDVLYLGQLESTRLETHRTDLNAFLQERLEVFRVAAQEKKIALVLDLPTETIHVAIHRDKFGRILDNLLSNALKFTPADGTIKVCLQAHEGHVRLTVQDTGLGIPAELQPHVFDKFSTASRPGLYGDTTTGLGLFITKQIVEMHQGQIWLESTENEGTTFFIDLK
ncbi:PAS domain-containing sensor histidine kinase [Hymenobacter bucti]|uniref:histidine kinase n=1 Tax=Hymenobacter bucti TaxID=1844114 RepID=A0ABW4QZT4_9BACT